MRRLHFVGDSSAARLIRTFVASAAQDERPVFISGGPGVGKELVARLIHQDGPRAGQPFVVFDAGAAHPDQAFEYLFGTRSPSLLQDTGTLLIDEITALAIPLQRQLIDVVASGVRPRLIFSSPHEPAVAVARGDLLPSLAEAVKERALLIPPLRERREDIVAIARAFLANATPEADRPKPTDFSDAAIARLLEHTYPGNVRELWVLIERSVLREKGVLIGPSVVP